MVQHKERRGVTEWIILVVSLGAVSGIVSLVNYYGGYVRLQETVKADCERLTTNISNVEKNVERIEKSGTSVSASNSQDIASLKATFLQIDHRLNNIERTQLETNKLLGQIASGREP